MILFCILWLVKCIGVTKGNCAHRIVDIILQDSRHFGDLDCIVDKPPTVMVNVLFETVMPGRSVDDFPSALCANAEVCFTHTYTHTHNSVKCLARERGRTLHTEKLTRNIIINV